MNDTQRFTHRDLLRLSHPKLKDSNLAAWILGNEFDVDTLPGVIRGFEAAKNASSENTLLDIIKEHDLSWEMIPNNMRTEKVWKALVNRGMPLGALIRQLPTLTRLGVLKPLSVELKNVKKALTDVEAIKRARIHPINILIALHTYASGGRSSRGSKVWTPEASVIKALNDAFYLAFDNVEATGKNFLLGLDVSPSMWGARVNDSGLSAADAVSALSLVIQKTEENTHSVAFTSGGRGYYSARGVTPLDISDADSLRDVIDTMRSFSSSWGGTDCALPMIYATENNLDVDVFIVLTDNDTWAGNIHPHEALKQYNKKMGKDAKMIVLATSPSWFSIADPDSNSMLDIAGFDSSVPSIISEFVNGF